MSLTKPHLYSRLARLSSVLAVVLMVAGISSWFTVLNSQAIPVRISDQISRHYFTSCSIVFRVAAILFGKLATYDSMGLGIPTPRRTVFDERAPPWVVVPLVSGGLWEG